MDISITKQPIVNFKQDIEAYQIVYQLPESMDRNVPDEQRMAKFAIKELITNNKIDELDTDKKIHIQFTNQMLRQDTPKIFNPKGIVVELVGSLDDNAINYIRDLKKEGYTICLNEFNINNITKGMLKAIDLVKINFELLQIDNSPELVQNIHDYNTKVLAKDIDSFKNFSHAKAVGCDLFQGFFFREPQYKVDGEMKTISSVYVLLLEELSKEETNFKRLEDIIKQDFSLTYKFLKLVNSVYYYSVDKIEDLDRALVRIGLGEIDKYIYLLLFRQLSVGSPEVVTQTSIIRGKFSELLAKELGEEDTANYFLAGIFSLIDAIVKRPKAEALSSLPLADDVKKALIDQEDNQYYKILKILEYYEEGNFEQTKILGKELGIDIVEIGEIYVKALRKSNFLSAQL